MANVQKDQTSAADIILAIVQCLFISFRLLSKKNNNNFFDVVYFSESIFTQKVRVFLLGSRMRDQSWSDGGGGVGEERGGEERNGDEVGEGGGDGVEVLSG